MKESTYEPMAVLSGKDRWYQNRETNQGVCFHTSVPVGYVPATEVMLDGAEMDAVEGGAEVEVSMKTMDGVVVEGYSTDVNVVRTSVGGSAMVRASRVEGIEAGTYYMEYALRVGGDRRVMVSEPFVMCDVSGMVHVRYKSTEPISVKGGVVMFDAGRNEYEREMWIESSLLMPPYNFDEEVTSRDGFDFVEKKVSYKNHKFWLMCSEYFADALRMMWHCDDVEIEYMGELYDVDQVTIGIDWGESNHLCRADVEFRTDTIIQTNGVSVL